jgi:hypothetical protein
MLDLGTNNDFLQRLAVDDWMLMQSSEDLDTAYHLHSGRLSSQNRTIDIKEIR